MKYYEIRWNTRRPSQPSLSHFTQRCVWPPPRSRSAQSADAWILDIVCGGRVVAESGGVSYPLVFHPCLSPDRLNPRTVGGLSHLRTAGGTYVPPANSITTQRIDKRKKHSTGLTSPSESTKFVFMWSQNWGHQRSSNKIFQNFRITWHGFILSALSRSL